MPRTPQGYFAILAFIFLLLVASACTKPAGTGSILDEVVSNPELDPDKLAEITDTLKSQGILEEISGTDYDFLQAEIRSGQLKTVPEVLAKAGKAIIIDETAIKTPAPGHYRQLYEQLLKLNSNISYESPDFSFIEVDDYDGEKTKQILAKFSSEGRQYERINYYSEYTFIDSSFYRIVNRLLADKGSQYRIYEISLYCVQCNSSHYVSTSTGTYKVDRDRFGLIMLNKEQADYLSKNYILDIGYKEHELLSTWQIEAAVENFKNIGLFRHLNTDELNQAKGTLFRGDVYDSFTILNLFPGIIYGFDTETGNFDNPYEEITLGMAAVSHGKFTPNNIKDRFEYDTASEFSFSLSGKKYSTILETSGDWLDVSLIELINRALAENSINGKFYIMEDGQYVSVIFLESTQYSALKDIMPGLKQAGESQAVEEGKAFEDLAAEKIKQEYNLSDEEVKRNVQIPG